MTKLETDIPSSVNQSPTDSGTSNYNPENAAARPTLENNRPDNSISSSSDVGVLKDEVPNEVLQRKRVAWAFNIAPWKRDFLQRCFPELDFKYIAFRDTIARHEHRIKDSKDCVFVVWGLFQPEDLESYALQHGIPVMRMEDGFIRSSGLGANHVLPYSICIDKTGIYFDSRRSCDLEYTLLNYNFDADPELMAEAQICISLVKKNKITKYNGFQEPISSAVYGKKNGTRILVIGQVEDDQSVIFGCDKPITNNDVVRIAHRENPGAQIIYKVHPDVLAGKRSELSNPNDVADLALIVREPMSLDDALHGIDRVYTISSLAGFEALIRGIPVTTLGAPFYSGWGVTDDRQLVERRNRKLTLLQIFAIAYLKYAIYFDPATGNSLTAREVIEKLSYRIVNQPGDEKNRTTSSPVVALFGAPYPLEMFSSISNGAEILLVDRSIDTETFRVQWVEKICNEGSVAYIWGGRLPESIIILMQNAGVVVYSVTPGVVHRMGIVSPPFAPSAWNIEPYEVEAFDGPDSYLVRVLEAGDFLQDRTLLNEAEQLAVKLTAHLDSISVAKTPTHRLRSGVRILVLGQPEDHAEVRYQGGKQFNSNDLVVIAHLENPGAEIFYRPDVANVKRKRPALSNPQLVKDYCSFVPTQESLSTLINSCDHVFTISHIGGFEAILRGKTVTVFGRPFYSGWGLSEDRQKIERVRSLSANQLFAGSCLFAATYMDPVYKLIGSESVGMLRRLVEAQRSVQEAALVVSTNHEETVTARAMTPTYVIGECSYKSWISSWFPGRKFAFIPANISEMDFSLKYKKNINQSESAEIFICTDDLSHHLKQNIKSSGRKSFYLRDGFIRSIGLPHSGEPPHSVILDSTAPHYDCSRASDLENMLSQFDFSSDKNLLPKAKDIISKIIENDTAKFGKSQRLSNIDAILGLKSKPRILVLGQIENSTELRLSNPRGYSNSDIVMIAAMENENSQIIFKPHPVEMHLNGGMASGLEKVKHLCEILNRDIPLSQLLEHVDRVYTISSLGGFEALIRNVNVTTLGCPFYAGWGVSDDRESSSRRQRKLSIEEIFAVAYLIYPIYVDPIYKNKADIVSIIDRLHRSRRSYLLGINQKEDIGSKSIEAPVLTAAEAVIPNWFNGMPGMELSSALQQTKPIFLFIPWIAEHGNKLIAKINSTQDYILAPLDFVKDPDENRREVLRFARRSPHIYRKMIIRRLTSLRGHIKGVILTFDWAPVMRIIATVCRDLDIPTILIPHESVFVDRNKYYWDFTAHASVPSSDVILGWGELQQSIFTERGYPSDRFIAVGAPKFDSYHNYRPELTREQFCRLFGLDPKRKIILFASQPLDSQLDVKIARESQQNAISDLLDCAELKDMQLVVRLPPSKDNILGESLQAKIMQSKRAAIDDALCYLVTPEEAIYHSDIVSSVNSTMLFEGLLMGRAPLSTKYVEFTQIWEQAGIPAARNKEEISAQLDSVLSEGWEPSVTGMEWAAQMFSVGTFDGKACERIKKYLRKVAKDPDQLTLRPTVVNRIFGNVRHDLDVIGIPSSESNWLSRQQNLLSMLRARKRVDSGQGLKSLRELASVDLFIQWGAAVGGGVAKQAIVQRMLGKPMLYVEDGFILNGASRDKNGPVTSIIIDDVAPYYSEIGNSRLQDNLQNGDELDADKFSRSVQCIKTIVDSRITKVSQAPMFSLAVGTPGRRKVLVIDQNIKDYSIPSELVKNDVFEKMLKDVINKNPDCDIIIKQCTDVENTGSVGFFSEDRIRFGKYVANIYPLSIDVNPHALFEMVTDVYTVTSNLGFEALMAGNKVHCYGLPFYAGWGLTEDQYVSNARSRRRRLEDIFHAAYIDSSRYFDPVKGKAVELEEYLDYIKSSRGW